MKHTPIPKLFTEKIATDDWTIYFTDSDGDIHILATNLTEEGTQFIVTACNMHKELVEALKVATSYVEYVEQAPDSDPEDTTALDLCQAALAKAGK